MKQINDIDFQNSDVYWYMNKFVRKIQILVSNYVQKRIGELCYDDYLYYAKQNITNFKFQKFPIRGGYLGDHLSGMLVVKKDVKIFINSNYELEEQHQAFFHELVHFYRHAVMNNEKTQTFSELINLNYYPFDDRLCETEANYGAGFLLLPSYTIDQLITFNYPWNEVISEFEISSKRLTKRLLDFLIFENSVDFVRADRLVSEMQNNGFGILSEIEVGWREKYMTFPEVSYDYIRCAISKYVAESERNAYLYKVNGDLGVAYE
ncbi:Zn-dependent peptidase ImmA (M78 family) [Weissella uvarum]|uniref:ImmA/IrrE family metallo-endopeptidase n=1 Tax=Weissella uvarum TaxID=1479233 RepID=UPI001960FD8F|nr:ImmA/IrrE family metallo-endopeptidase [Weissella uvarum]MBM7616687.1 Zn-dependent peptidase ImmA (M78 family) [Weissella uvarum]MCM0594858.1 ImmA/IrrE family metallo-endopeptidase [Weissella uvarum]